VSCLLDNAREAIPGSGQVVLSATARTLDADDSLEVLGTIVPGPCVEICIRDNGTGIPPDVRARLFQEMFYTSKPRHRGLGLFVAYGLIASHQGGLRVTPRAEGGTTAHVFLPVLSVSPGASSPGLSHRTGSKSAICGETYREPSRVAQHNFV
jgi:signal transduction histidine kinase